MKKGALNTFTIEKLGRGLVISLVLAALIIAATSLYLVREITNLNTSWAVHEKTIVQKQAYLNILRGAIGYGGMIHNFKNYLLRHEQRYLLLTHESMLEVRIVISGYRVLGVSGAEEDALDDLETVVDAYKAAVTRAEALININYPAAELDRQVEVDDTPAVRALLRLTNAVAALRQAKAKKVSKEISILADTINSSAIGVGFLLVSLILVLAWFLRNRLIHPLGKLLTAFDEISPGTPDRQRLPVAESGGDELDKLARAGNRFLDSVDRHLLELQYAEKALDEHEAFTSAVVGSMVDGVITIDERGSITSFNNAAETIFGYDVDDVIGKNVNILMPEPHHSDHDRYLANYFNSGQAKNIGTGREVIGLRKDGTEFPMSLSFNEVQTGSELQFSGIVRDISRFKEAEKKLRESEEMLSTAIDTIPDGFVIFDAYDRLVRSNSKFRHLFSRSFDLLTPGRTYEEILREGAARGEFEGAIGREDDWVAEQMQAWKKNRDPYEMDLGGGQWILATDRLLPDGGHVGVRTDISARKQAEQDLQSSEERFRNYAAAASDWFWEMDANLRFTYVSNRFFEISGVSPENLIGKTRAEFVPAKAQTEEANKWKRHLDDLASHRPFQDFSYPLLSPDKGIVHLSINGVPVFTGKGEFLGYRGTGSDVTDRVRAEESLRLAKAEAEKANEAKSEFLSSMSHELRTPLHAILGFGQMLETDQTNPLNDIQERCVNRIMKGGRHLLELINAVLDLAKIEVGHVDISIEDVSALEVVEECLDMVRTMADARNIKIHKPQPDPSLPMIRADRTRLHQVMLNLLSNAVKYNRENGSITVDMQSTPGGKLRISVTDTGNGISEDQMDKLFEPFNRLSAEKTEIEGTGIGLTVTKQLVELMGGAIIFKSKVGKGSTASVDFRQSDEETLRAAKAAQKEGKEQITHSLKSAATMLYVEDNPANMELMEMIVSRIEGLTMIQAPNAELGLELAKSQKPNLIILDINLPGMSGIEALQELQRSKETADIPVYALSAAATRRDIEKGLKAGFREYLTKPIDMEDTLSIIKRIVEAAA